MHPTMPWRYYTMKIRTVPEEEKCTIPDTYVAIKNQELLTKYYIKLNRLPVPATNRQRFYSSYSSYKYEVNFFMQIHWNSRRFKQISKSKIESMK